jgi:pilus assembly protein CpaB
LKRRTLTIALAGMLALLGAVAVLAYARQADNRAVAGMKAETVLWATHAIPRGTSLAKAQKEHWLGSEKVPAGSLSDAEPAVRSVTAANTSMVVSADVPTGQVLLQNMLESGASAAAAASPVVTISIPPGDVAVTLQLCAQEAVANYLTAGSYVDVYETAPVSPRANVQRTCDTGHVAVQPGDANTVAVLEDVEVLSVAHALPTSGQSTSSGGSSVTADPIGTALSQDAVAVTFAVKPGQEAETLITDAQVELPYLGLLPAASGGN